MEKVEYFNQPNCCKLSNGTVEVIVTTDIGPRVIRYAFIDGENILAELPDDVVETEYGTWKPHGGHRLWHAPEGKPRSYVPDNTPIEYEAVGENGVRLIQPVEEQTGIQKEMTVTLDDEGTGVTVEHKLTNHNCWGVDLAPWALSIMNGEGGGTVILPQEPFRAHTDYLLPARPMVFWHYTNLADTRWQIGPKFIRLNVDASLDYPQKVGIANKQGWAAYAHNGTLFVKRFEYEDEMTYPDCSCNCETFTTGSFVEVETVAPMHFLEPGQSGEHIEQWQLFKDVEIGETEDTLEAALKPLL